MCVLSARSPGVSLRAAQFLGLFQVRSQYAGRALMGFVPGMDFRSPVLVSQLLLRTMTSTLAAITIHVVSILAAGAAAAGLALHSELFLDDPSTRDE